MSKKKTKKLYISGPGKLSTKPVIKKGAAAKGRVSVYQQFRKAYKAVAKTQEPLKLLPNAGEFRTTQRNFERATGQKFGKAQIDLLIKQIFYPVDPVRLREIFVEQGFGDEVAEVSDEELRMNFKT